MDGAGGAIVAWQDGRNATSGNDIFAQHVLASGVVDPAWPANGRAVCTAPGPQGAQKIVSDGAGGAIVVWMDGRSSNVDNPDIFAQHVLASGIVDPAWPVNGAQLSIATTAQAFPECVSDGSGGAIVAWEEFSAGPSEVDLFAQHVTSAGIVDPAWPVNGRALSQAPESQEGPRIVSDGAHGAIVTWSDERDITAIHIFAQRVLGTGAIAPGWPVDGLAVCTATLSQIDPVITPDGASGAIVSWEDFRNGADFNLFAQHVLASGVVDAAWPVNGRALGQSAGNATETAIVGDAAGGAIVAWQENFFILAQHVQASGLLDPAFPGDGRVVRNVVSFQHTPDLVASGPGAAIVAWADAATGQNSDIYAQLVETSAAVAVDPDVHAPAITFAAPSPNPALAAVTLRFALPHTAHVSLAIFDASGRRVRALASGVEAEGAHTLTWDLRDEAGNVTGAGIYFARLDADGRVLTRKLARPQ
jgi:hypothetical protein